MSRKARTLRILQNVNFNLENSDTEIDTYTVQDDGTLQKENEDPSPPIISGPPQNIYIFKDGSVHSRSDTLPAYETERFDEGLRSDYVSSSPSLTNQCSNTLSSSIISILEDNVEATVSQALMPIKDKAETTGLLINHESSAEVAELPTSLEVIAECSEPPKKRQKKCQPDQWNVSRNQKNREKGKAYMGKKKVDNKWQFNEPKPERQLKERCACKLSLKKNTKIQCYNITDEDRVKIWQNFWQLTWNEKKIFVKSFSIYKNKERVRSEGPTSRRKHSVELFLLSDGKKERFRVCKTMFLNTLSIGEWAIKKWIIDDQDNNEPKERPKNNKRTECTSKLRQFFESLPKMESHYCRKDSSKLYLEPIWTSKTQLYKAYQNDFCESENLQPLSMASFHNLFDELNLSLYRPKKDLCDVCEGFKTKNISYDSYKEHIEKKDEARNEKKKDKESNHVVLTMDLQSVLLSPKSNVSSLYYKTKLIVHNFTLYNIKEKKGYCFIWNETEGKLTANEFSTIIISALKKIISGNSLEKDQEIIIYSDGCTYQNRNAVLSNAILNFCMENNIMVTQKYLEKGHTQMECDSMHSVIEKALRHKKINVPADYAYCAKIACKKSPYDVTYLYHDFFKDIEHTLNFYKSIRPGKRVGDPAVTDLRALRYNPDGIILYKLRHSETYRSLPTRVLRFNVIPFDNIPKLYSARIPIKKEKYQHLQELKNTMEKDYHNFYDNLPHS